MQTPKDKSNEWILPPGSTVKVNAIPYTLASETVVKGSMKPKPPTNPSTEQNANQDASCNQLKTGIQHLSDCAVHNEPAYPAGPCDCGALTKQALEKALLALSACHNCLTTDRPDLPLDKETSWTINNSQEIALINQALEAFSTDNDHE